MILAAVVLFCLAVGLGAWLVVLGVRYRRGSRAVAAAHASLALLGLIVLGGYIFSRPTVNILYNNAALLFFLALAGGLVLLALRIGHDDPRTPPPMIGVSLHAALALLAFVLLVLGYVGSLV